MEKKLQERMSKKSTDKEKNFEEKIIENIKKQLAESEVMNKIKADLRKNVLNIIRGKDIEKPLSGEASTSIDSPVVLMNHLILDYFTWMCYEYSSDMLKVECGIKNKIDRKKLKSKFKKLETSNDKTPILLEIMLNSLKKSD